MITEKVEADTIQSTDVAKESAYTGSERKAWIDAFKQIFPIYLSTHLAFAGLTYFAAMLRIPAWSTVHLSIRTLLSSWFNWDSIWYANIALHGYYSPQPMAFFPLFPVLERLLMPLTHSPFYAGLLISNVAGLGVLVVLYRLVAADFGHERAWRTTLYLAVFPTAFFFAAAYTESLFMLFVLLTFFLWRRGHWWWASLTALIAGLTRSTAVFLLFPFAYEYFRQCDFQWRKIRFDILSGIGILGGVVLFAIYGYLKFRDPLAFSHAQQSYQWNHYLAFPWVGFQLAVQDILRSPLLSFISLHTMIDLSIGLFVLVVLVLSVISSQRFRKEHLTYTIYAIVLYLSVIMVPAAPILPINSLSRYVLELFPVFIVLSGFGHKRNFNLYYLSFSAPFLAFLLLLWVTGGAIF